MSESKHQKYRYIVVEGNIGAGKTSLARLMAQDLNARLFLEQYDDNPFLPKFYGDPGRYSFALELSFLADRYKQMNRELRSGDLFRSVTMADYHFFKSLVFSKNTLSGEEYKLYRKIFDVVYESIPKPDLIVYLHVKPERLLEQISKRGRAYEKGINEKYLLQIQEGYFSFFRQHPELRYLVLDVNNIDFVKSQQDYHRLMEVITYKPCKEGLNLVIL